MANSFRTISYNSSTKVLTIDGIAYTLDSTASGESVSCGSFGGISLTDAGVLTIDGTVINLPLVLPDNLILDTNGDIIKASDGYLITSLLAAPRISLYDSDSALKIESIDDEEDEYEIYVDDVSYGIFNKGYDFTDDGNGELTSCIGRQYYTGEIVTPQSINNVAITRLRNYLFSDTVASKITISEGVTTLPASLFASSGMQPSTTTTTTENIIFPSTATNLACLGSYSKATLNIGLQGYIEYGWTTALPTPTGNELFLSTSWNTTINFYVKSTIVTFNNYSLYIGLRESNTVNYYFEESANETITFGTNLLYVGTNKIKATYNIYTDNASIKDTMLTYAGTNCTVNVYKRDGGSW